jgi:hypothetical protein
MIFVLTCLSVVERFQIDLKIGEEIGSSKSDPISDEDDPIYGKLPLLPQAISSSLLIIRPGTATYSLFPLPLLRCSRSRAVSPPVSFVLRPRVHE